MASTYAPHRRKVLALHHAGPPTRDSDYLASTDSEKSAASQRQIARPIPDSVRSLGEPLEPFFEACGGQRTIALSVVQRDGQTPAETRVLRQPFILIGRCKESDLPLHSEGISFRHFYLQLVAGRWFFVDLSIISAEEADHETVAWDLFDVDSELVAGPCTITRVADASSTALTRSTDLAAAELRDLRTFRLELLNGPADAGRPRALRIDKSLTLIGASRQCGV